MMAPLSALLPLLLVSLAASNGNEAERYLIGDTTPGEQLNKQRRTLLWAAEVALNTRRALVLPHHRWFPAGSTDSAAAFAPWETLFELAPFAKAAAERGLRVLTTAQWLQAQATAAATLDIAVHLSGNGVPGAGCATAEGWVLVPGGGYEGRLWGGGSGLVSARESLCVDEGSPFSLQVKNTYGSLR